MGCSQREMERNKIASRETSKAVFETADRLGICWPLDDDITNADLERLLFPNKYKNACLYVEPDYQYIHRELAKPGVTLTLLWEEYRSKCYETGKTPYMSTQFGDKYRKWARVTKATMRIQHKPGDAIQVDWAGDTIPIYDSVTGQQSSAYLFVAVLPCSYYAYTEACADMKTENWLNCHVHAFNYFGGVTRLLIPDNCKTATSSNTRYDTVLNRSYQELADYYAIGQCTPGVIAVNTATFIGYKQRGVAGGIFATLGVAFPSLVIITIIAAFLQNFAEYKVVQDAFAGISVCVCVLILNAVLKLWKKSVVSRSTLGIFLAVFGGSVASGLAGLDVSPVVMVVLAGVAGVVLRVVGRACGGDSV